MNIILFYIIYSLTNLFNLYLTYKYIKLFLGNAIVERWILIFTYVSSFVIGTCQYLFFPIALLNLIVSLIFFLLLTRCYTKKLSKIILTSSILFMCQFISETVVAIFIGIGKINITTENYNFDSFQIISVQIISVVIYRLISTFKNIGNNILIPTTFNIGSLCLCICSFILETTIFTQSYINANIKILSIICMILILFTIMYLYDLISKNYVETLQSKLIEQEKNYYYKQAQLMQQNGDNLKKFRHDINNHLYILNSLISNDNFEAQKYIEELTGKLNQSSAYSNTGNIVLDSIINYKLTEASKNNIDISFHILLPQNLNISNEDTITILGNILDNAIEAVNKLPTNRYINLTIKYKIGTLFILLENPYDGNILSQNGVFKTNKEDDTIHGIGLQSVQSAISKYNGILKIDYTNNKFHLCIMLYV